MMRVRWHRALALYSVVAVLCLALGLLIPAPLGGILLAVGVCLIGAFVPLIMFAYFLRGLLGIQ